MRAHAGAAAARQSGAALVHLSTLLLLVSAAAFVDRTRFALTARADRTVVTARSLAEAKAALIGWAVTAYPSPGKQITPGLLPFPDRNRDGNYDGKGDCVTFGLNDSHLLGRLPWAGDVSPCPRIGLHIDVRDGAGERLWYAVSRNLVTRGGGGPINSDMSHADKMIYPWITLYDAKGKVIPDPATGNALPIAAVIIAPGAALEGQDRSGPAPGPAEFLDSVSIGAVTFDNADADGCPDAGTAPCGSSPAGEEFILYPSARASGVFNDRGVYITANELMRAVEKRVLGEAAIALNAYRRGHGVYPWLVRFRSPRAVASGIASSGGRTFMNDLSAGFTDPVHEVRPGDTVVNLHDGGRAPISSVAGKTVEFTALSDGVSNDFDAGESYTIEPSFKSTLSRRGQLPVHLANEIFSTSFGGAWSFVDASPTTGATHSGDPSLIPQLSDVEAGLIDVTSGNGRCKWTDWTRVDCVGSSIVPAYFRPDLGLMVRRTVEVAFSFVDEFPIVTPPASADVRRRALSINGAPLPFADLPRLSEDGWSIRITDDDGVDWGQRDITIDSDTAGAITVSGIRFDLSVVYDGIDDERDELPEWFAENNWHHVIYAAFSSDAVAGGDADGDGDCSTPVNTCLTLNVAGLVARTDVRALLVSAGAEWADQDRSNGDCDGDGIGDDFLCVYFEGDNGDRSNIAQSDTFARDRFSADFNDQIRIVAPSPP
jgi:hypothetical protein